MPGGQRIGSCRWSKRLLQESHPAIGFFSAEARLAKRVTVGGCGWSDLGRGFAMLRQSGCQVERLLDDGTLVAT